MLYSKITWRCCYEWKSHELEGKNSEFGQEEGYVRSGRTPKLHVERFLERLSKSKYKDKFILKGGILIAALVGIDNRATMDMDATIKNYPINVESLTKAINDICSIVIDDDVSFSFSGIDAIRDDDAYGGYRVSIMAEYDTITTPMQIDITTGDAITPKEVLYLFKMIFEEGSFGVWAYNIETVLAEKVETTLRRGELNTRPRDFYDVYILTKTQSFDYSVFVEALRSTATHRWREELMDKRIEGEIDGRFLFCKNPV